jgi:hypothetical protein
MIIERIVLIIVATAIAGFILETLKWWIKFFLRGLWQWLHNIFSVFSTRKPINSLSRITIIKKMPLKFIRVTRH